MGSLNREAGFLLFVCFYVIPALKAVTTSCIYFKLKSYTRAIPQDLVWLISSLA